MLVLARFQGESIIIDSSDGLITITPIEIRSDGVVRIGIDAPRNVCVDREEVYDAKARDKERKERWNRK